MKPTFITRRLTWLHRSVSTDGDEMREPALIVVAGRPGAGKTTLAHALARAIRCPAICRDEIKEGLVRTSGAAGELEDNLARHANDAFFDTVALLVARSITVVAEAAFQHKVWAPRLAPLRPIARVRILLCEIGQERALARRISRGLDDPDRTQFHPEATGGDRATAIYDPPHIDVPTLRVDTSDGYSPTFESIVEFASA